MGFVGLRLFNRPYGVFLLRGGDLPGERIWGFSTDFRGVPTARSSIVPTYFFLLGARLDLTQLPFLGAKVQRRVSSAISRNGGR